MRDSTTHATAADDPRSFGPSWRVVALAALTAVAVALLLPQVPAEADPAQ